ncbi:hypothetical protein [Neisseria sp. 83E34]|uniref:hypothetical protein n=1 Tax=Neisseria sp. 83E34 TaxID=1692264 RepID=UPI0006CE7BB4|nr:hypothetical protein [Neisseria sp. 83E34]
MLKHLIAAVSLLCAVMPASARNTVSQKADRQAQPKDTVVRNFTAFRGDAENGWRAVVRGGRMELETVRPREYHRSIPVRRSAYAKGVELTGKTRFGEVVLNINGKRCRDAGGRLNEFTATLHYRGKTTKGCAVRGAYGTAPT